MKILVFSDSHGYVGNMKQIVDNSMAAKSFVRPDAIVHLGDGAYDIKRCNIEGRAVYTVRGNCDFFDSAMPSELLISLEECKILIMHGHLLEVKQGIERAALYATKKGADLLLFGHTHRVLDMSFCAGETLCGEILSKNIRVFNPGSIGFGSDASCGIVNINGKSIDVSTVSGIFGI